MTTARTPKTAMAARWILRPADDDAARALGRRLGIHPAVARVLSARGWGGGAECDEFLAPRLASLRDPYELRDMDRAVERILRAVRAGERILVFGDYDVDGVSSTAILVTTLRRLGADPAAFIPHRIHDGYGMNADRMGAIAADGVRLVVTVDTGITAFDAVAAAKALGVDVVVTDHHLAEGGAIPDAAAVVNPNRPDAVYEHGRLCGAGVAFKLAHALLKESGIDRHEAVEFLKDLMDLVALGTIADVAPLRGENRVLVRYGLERLARTRRPGLRALLDATKLSQREVLEPNDVAFLLGPRLNAAGRTDHAQHAYDLLVTEDAAEAASIAQRLEQLNRQRRAAETGILGQTISAAEEQIEGGLDSLLVVGGEHWHLGIVGIVAARLAERFHRPAIVLRVEPDLAKGSARSIAGFDIHEALAACDEHLLGWGGHAAAAGVQVHPDNLDALREALNEHAAAVFQQRDLSPELEIDADLEHEDFGWGLFRDMQRLQPFGQDNPAPVFRMRGVRSARAPRIVGRNHLKLDLRTQRGIVSGIGFGLGGLLPLCGADAEFDVAIRPMESTFRGETKLEAELLDARPCA